MPYDVIWLDIEHTDGKRYVGNFLVLCANADKVLPLGISHRSAVLCFQEVRLHDALNHQQGSTGMRSRKCGCQLA